MSFDFTAVDRIFDRVASHAASLSLFDTPVVTHEPKNPPGQGVWCALWTDAITPIPRFSGLNDVGLKVQFRIRIGASFLSEPQDSIDPNVMKACTVLMSEYAGHFTLDGAVTAVDLLGMYGQGLVAKGAFITIQQRVYRVLEIILPLIIEGAWTEAP